jgi:hypothetical protein
LNRRDIATYSRYIADDFINTDDDGSLANKAGVIKENSKSPNYVHADVPRDYVVHLYGDTAVVNNRVTVHQQFDVDTVSEQRRTETYIKRNGNWQAIAVQQTALPVNFRKPVAIGPGSLKDYVGQYQSRPGEVETVFVRDGKLWSQIGAEEPDECLPAGNDSFFFKDDFGSETYTRDAHGKVNGYTYTLSDGQRTHSRKIK